MAAFTDSSGKVWRVNITVRTMILARRALNINLCDLCGSGPETDRARDLIFNNIENFAQVLWFSLLDPPSSMMELASNLKGDSYAEAQSAFAESLIEFFPDPMMRQLLTKIYKNAARLAQMTESAQMTEIQSLVREHIATCSN